MYSLPFSLLSPAVILTLLFLSRFLSFSGSVCKCQHSPIYLPEPRAMSCTLCLPLSQLCCSSPYLPSPFFSLFGKSFHPTSFSSPLLHLKSPIFSTLIPYLFLPNAFVSYTLPIALALPFLTLFLLHQSTHPIHPPSSLSWIMALH